MNNLNVVRGTPDTDFGVRSEVVLYGEQGQRLQPRVVTLLSEPNRILCAATDEERQEIVSFTTPFNTRFSLTDERPRSANYYGNLI